MKEIQSYLVNNDCYKVNKKMEQIKGVLVHSTATPGGTPENFAKSWNTSKPGGRSVCVHAFMDNEKVINTLPYNVRSWGCGGVGNDHYIQIEMCEPSEVYFGDGWVYATKNAEATQAYINDAVVILCEFIVARLKELGITEINEDTVTSHYEAHQRGWASNHGDPRGFLGLGGYTMDDVRNKCRELMEASKVSSYTEIMGISELSKESMVKYLRKVNEGLWQAEELVSLYIEEGAVEGVRGDIAFAQSLLETGNFKFAGSAVEFSDYNFAGLGVTVNGKKGNIFPDMRTGIKAQIQHLKAYASNLGLNDECVDVRFKYVQRGIAPYVEWLGIQENPQHRGWAAGKDYGNKILEIMERIRSLEVSEKVEDKVEEKVEEHKKEEFSKPTNADVPFLVKLNNVMNIRSGPGTAFFKLGQIRDYGVYTIVEVYGDWGRLKSGRGWIHLGWSERVR